MRAGQVAVAVITVALILTLGFQAALAMAVLLGLCYALAGLAVFVMIWRGLRLEDSPAMLPAARTDPTIHPGARSLLDAHHDALVALGFEFRDMVQLVAHRSMPGGYLALYTHQGMNASAFSRVLLKTGKAGVASSEVEFEVSYDDGSIAELSNVVTPALAIERVPGVAVQMPDVTDVGALFAYFRKLVAKYERDTGHTAQSRLALPDDKGAGSLYQFQLARGHAIQHAAGLLRMTDIPGVWRPTWRSAVAIAGGAISPFRQLVHRRLRARGAWWRQQLDASPS